MIDLVLPDGIIKTEFDCDSRALIKVLQHLLERQGLQMCHELEQYAKLVSFLAETLGNTFEAGLFDMTDPEYPLIASANSHSSVQKKVRAFVAESVNSQRAQAESQLTNRPIELDFGKLLKVSVFFVRNAENQIVGALWLSMRCDLLMKMDSLLASMMQFNIEDVDAEEPDAKRTAAGNHEPSLDSITTFVNEFCVDPGRTSLAERQEIICDLYDMGVFNLKGAVAKTAEALHVSEQSVYRYVAKIKKARDW